jgi:sugar phosphate isomerase/epimerase
LIRCQTRERITPVAVARDPERPHFSISQVSTLTAGFADDLRTYADAGLDAIGIWELKLEASSLDRFRASDLGASTAVPQVPSILPLPLLPGPEEPRERVAALAGSIHRLAEFGPTAVLVLTGPAGDRADARTIVVDALGALAEEARSAGVRLALEPFQKEGIEDWSLINTIGDAAALIDEAGEAGTIGIQFDVWHLWNTPDLYDEIEREAHRFAGVHVNDRREPTRGWADRTLPGEGSADVPTILGALDSAGWQGYYDLEVFSDNGAFGTAYPDSLWDVEPAELVRRSREAFERCWQERTVAA